MIAIDPFGEPNPEIPDSPMFDDKEFDLRDLQLRFSIAFEKLQSAEMAATMADRDLADADFFGRASENDHRDVYSAVERIRHIVAGYQTLFLQEKDRQFLTATEAIKAELVDMRPRLVERTAELKKAQAEGWGGDMLTWQKRIADLQRSVAQLPHSIWMAEQMIERRVQAQKVFRGNHLEAFTK